MQLLLEEKKNPSLFRSPPPPPVVAYAMAELLRMQKNRRFATRVGKIAGGPQTDPTAKDDDSMGLVAVSEPMTTSSKTLGLIDEASSKRPRVAVGLGASASKVGSTFCSARVVAKFGLRGIRVGEASRSRFDPEGSWERCPVKSGLFDTTRRIEWFSQRCEVWFARSPCWRCVSSRISRREMNAEFIPYTDSSRFSGCQCSRVRGSVRESARRWK